MEKGEHKTQDLIADTLDLVVMREMRYQWSRVIQDAAQNVELFVCFVEGSLKI
jgi:hypothetical protein